MTLRYATTCSGIEGFGLGFDRAGMQCVYQCEIDPHCRKVLERHYPGIERGTNVNDDEVAEALVRLRPDVLAFGSPCQDLSVAGKGEGLAGKRSGLFFRCVELAYLCEAPVVVWENVPGAFSKNKGEDFASVLEAFTGHRPAVPKKGWRNTGVCIGPLYSVAWAVLDSRWFGVPQRRRRVFVVGSLGDRSSPYRILSLAESVPWNTPPSRKAEQEVAGTIDAGSGVRRGSGINPGILTPDVAASLTAGISSTPGVNPPGRCKEDDVNLVATWWNGDETTPCLDSSMLAKQQMMPEKNRFAAVIQPVTHTLRAEGHDASEDGTGRGVPLVPVAYQCHGSDVGPMGTLRAGHGDVQSGVPFLATHYAVRRLLPIECERLQGFPDGHTEFGADGKRISNSQRYKMLGNAITVNVAEWIGRRIVAVDGGRTDEG